MQKNILIVLAVVGTLTAGYFLFRSKPTQSVDVNPAKSVNVNPTTLKDIYNQWKVNYKINVGTAEDDYRFKVFSSNYDQITQHNKLLGKTYKLGLNAFSHLTQEEFSAIYLGADLQEDTGNATVLPTDNLKTNVDWREKLNPIKNQGKCGSCWAFSAVAAIEATHSITKDNLLDLSEQELVDCSRSYRNMGCYGGYKDRALKYVIDKGGLASQKDYPYTAVDETCKTSEFQRIGKISSYVTVTPKNPEALKAALNIQPVAVSVRANTWKSYSSGIINDASCGTKTNHAVLAVGYNTEGSVPYYIVRNSWGAQWGESGHIRIGIQSGIGICGIQKAPFYPVA